MFMFKSKNLIEMIKKLTLNDKLYPGLDKINKVESGNPDKPFLKPESIPGVLESGWTLEDYYELKK
mgnify:CR=1 FL=1